MLLTCCLLAADGVLQISGKRKSTCGKMEEGRADSSTSMQLAVSPSFGPDVLTFPVSIRLRFFTTSGSGTGNGVLLSAGSIVSDRTCFPRITAYPAMVQSIQFTARLSVGLYQ